MKDPGMYYCAEHNGLCISQDYEDTVRFTGITEQSIIKFVSGLFKHNPQLATSLKKEFGCDVKATSTTSKQRKTKSSVEAA